MSMLGYFLSWSLKLFFQVSHPQSYYLNLHFQLWSSIFEWFLRYKWLWKVRDSWVDDAQKRRNIEFLVQSIKYLAALLDTRISILLLIEESLRVLLKIFRSHKLTRWLRIWSPLALTQDIIYFVTFHRMKHYLLDWGYIIEKVRSHLVMLRIFLNHVVRELIMLKALWMWRYDLAPTSSVIANHGFSFSVSAFSWS